MTPPLSHQIRSCRVCDGSPIETILSLGEQPLANSLRADRDEVLPMFPLDLCRCTACGTIQLNETVAPEILFEHYLWVTGTSDTARQYSNLFCDQLVGRAHPGKLFVVEVASNDGTFLRPFVERGHDVLGVDPARNLAAIAGASGIPTVAAFFGLEQAKAIVGQHGTADAVFARNVIPHVANAHDVVAGMAHALSDRGIGAIEFHRADVILEELHYDSIYHEHLYYHSLHSMSYLLERFGLIPFDVLSSPISGGSWVVYFSKEVRPPTSAYAAAVAREEMLGVGDAAPWREFARKCAAHREQLRDVILARKAEGKRIIGYGASARSSTLLNYCGIDDALLDAIIDRSPLKHGTYTPGTNIRIVPGSDAFANKPDVILLLAWNFKDEILAQIRAEHGWQGEVIVPLPGEPMAIDFA